MTVIDDEERAQLRRTFSSFKHRMTEALAVDHRLTPSAFKVGATLLSFMNRESGEIFPPIETLAAITGLSARSVRYCLESLAETGWLSWHRGNRQLANQYQFEVDNLDVMTNRRHQILADIKAAKRARRTNPDRQRVAAQSRIPSGNGLPLQTGNRLPPNLVMEPRSKKGAAA